MDLEIISRAEVRPLPRGLMVCNWLASGSHANRMVTGIAGAQGTAGVRKSQSCGEYLVRTPRRLPRWSRRPREPYMYFYSRPAVGFAV